MSTTTQHTPGPWQFNDSDACIWPGMFASRRAPVATVFTAAQPEGELSQESDYFTDEEAANARLIAAAPDLLEAAERMIGFITHTLPAAAWMNEPWLQPAREAIAKARGES